jgi:hypothetical protein
VRTTTAASMNDMTPVTAITPTVTKSNTPANV